jgi:tight adherence protein B
VSGLELAMPVEVILKWSSVGLVGISLFVGAWSATVDTGGPVLRVLRAYISWLERELRIMFVFVPGKRIVASQALVMLMYLTAAILFEIPYWWVGVVLICAGPVVWVKRKRIERLEAIEFQLDSFIQALANALKSTAQIGSALTSTVDIIQEPMRSEIELVTKEMKVGSSLDQALLQMASRIGSRPVDTALSAILIGRTVGGNLPKVLESTAHSLREMQRLEGVIRTKTADGRMQMWAIGAMPAAVVLGLNFAWPGYFQPMTTSLVGYALIGGIVVCWIGAIILARKVLAVDI